MLRGVRVGARDQVRVVGDVGKTGPDFLTGDGKVVPLLHRLGAQRRQVRARPRLAHPQTKNDLSFSEPREDLGLLLLAAVRQQGRADLPVAEPVGGDGRPRAQQLLGQDHAVKIAFLLAAVFFRPGEADPPARAELAREFRRIPGNPAVFERRVRGNLLSEKLADLRTEGLLLGGQGEIHYRLLSPVKSASLSVPQARARKKAAVWAKGTMQGKRLHLYGQAKP